MRSGLTYSRLTAPLLAIVLCTGSAAAATPPASRADLEKQAQARVEGTARVALAPVTAEALAGIAALEAPDRVPNYLRALAANHPPAAAAMAKLVHAVLFEGSVPAETKLAMGLRIAQLHAGPYVASHMERYLKVGEAGRRMLGSGPSAGTPEALALEYAEKLTGNVNGVSRADFQRVRAHYNDSQIVELTFTVCFFNYLTRFTEGLALPVERWVLETPAKLPAAGYEPPLARVALVSDAQVEEVERMKERVKQFASRRGSGLAFANSLRAMLLSPAIGGAWMDYMMSVRGASQLDREMALHVSFAVSMANGCRYCTLHQVQGLRRAGVSISKLVAMRKDDSALAPRELAAVELARKLTREPAGLGAEWDKARTEFGDRGALELLMQTCTFAFMNRFTDGLQLPSEDEAIEVYREVYGRDWEKP
jgi:AhpD family alkylhydroperoxidase